MTGISLDVELDPDIDKIGGIFVGDEMRLRQVARYVMLIRLSNNCPNI